MNKRTFWLIIIILIIALGLIAGWFFWFEWRPAKIRNKCTQQNRQYFEKDRELGYTDCVRWWGLKEKY